MVDTITEINGILVVQESTTELKTTQVQPAIAQLVNAISSAIESIPKDVAKLDNIANMLTDDQIRAMSTEVVFFASRYNDRFKAFVKPVEEL